MNYVACRVCSHPKRRALEEAAMQTGARLVDVAVVFAVSANALARHVARHDPIQEPPEEIEEAPPTTRSPGVAAVPVESDERMSA